MSRLGTLPASGQCVATIRSFRDLSVWQKSMNLAHDCYLLAKQFAAEDRFVLGREIRKSCVSIPSNIAEGFGRHYTQEYIRHLRISKGSDNELQTQLELGRRIRIVSEAEAVRLIANAEEIGRMLDGLIGSLDRR
jgi:four helix bundle protein